MKYAKGATARTMIPAYIVGVSSNKTKNETMKTAEEILKEYVAFEDMNGNESVTLLPLTIIDAMEEYADQFRQPEVTNSVCELLGINGNEYCGYCGGKLTIMTYGKYQCFNKGCKSNNH